MKHLRIILTGFMGTGKTAVGEQLAKKLNYKFLDTDLLVEAETGKSITEIFEKEGEPAFRVHEKKMVKKALEKDKVVVATGGGAVIDPENLKLMKERGVLIGLAASPEAILKRVATLDTRPLLKSDKQEKDRLEKIKSLMSKRSVFYREADCFIETTSKAIEDTVEEIFKFLNENHSR